jgi:glycosyltransferase involved in cell wall biosynthesis
MIENRDFIVFGLQPWDLNIASTCKYTAIEMSRKNRVLFVNPPLTRNMMMNQKDSPEVKKRMRIMKGEDPEIEQVNDNMWVLYPKTMIESINKIPINCVFDFFNRMNNKRVVKRIKLAVQKLGFKNYFMFDDNNMTIGYYFKEMLKPDMFIYLLRDAVTLVSYHKKHGARLQPKLIQKSDFAVCNSEYFTNYARETNPRSFMIGQGCDLRMYSDKDGSLKVPEDLAKIPGPRIGYVGFLTKIRLDIDALVYIAEKRPDWNLTLVGPEDDAFKNSKLHQLNNVFFLGRKAPDELAAYIKGFDVALNPQIVNQITDVNYPLKIDEYLAMGKPTVATKTTFMAYFKDYVLLPATHPEYVEAIDKALKENSPEEEKRRIEYAGTHTWASFVDKIYKYIEETQALRKK